MQHSPYFLVFEGPDGAGKGEAVRCLSAYFAHRDVEIVTMPGNKPDTVGDMVYHLHHGDAEFPIHPRAMQALHLAAHIDQIYRFIWPALHEGKILLVDRSWMSLYSYLRFSDSPWMAFTMIKYELQLWSELPTPVYVYIDRVTSLKPMEIPQDQYDALKGHYQEAIAIAKAKHWPVVTVENSGDKVEFQYNLLRALELGNGGIDYE